MRSLAALAATLAVAAAACDHDTNLGGDGGPDDATIDTIGDSADADADADADAAADAVCVEGSYWDLVERTVASFELLHPSRYGATDRLVVNVQLLSGCERLGRVVANFMPGDATDFLEISAWAWAPVGLDCPPSAPIVPWIVTIPGRGQGNLRVVVSDGHAPIGEGFSYGRDACSGPPDCMCYAGVPDGDGEEGSECLTDCSCAAGLACLGFEAFEGYAWACGRACSDFLDCALGEACPDVVDDGAPFVCSSSGPQCSDERPCPIGFECTFSDTTGDRCDDRRSMSNGADCSCDADCTIGQWCTMTFRGRPTCEIPCLRDADCPNPPGTTIFVCGTNAICVPLV